jgi:hypothetical protein
MNRFRRSFSRKRPDQDRRRMRETEPCVVCRIDTRVPKALDISQRLYYITGVGQHCHDCYTI